MDHVTIRGGFSAAGRYPRGWDATIATAAMRCGFFVPERRSMRAAAAGIDEFLNQYDMEA